MTAQSGISRQKLPALLQQHQLARAQRHCQGAFPQRNAHGHTSHPVLKFGKEIGDDGQTPFDFFFETHRPCMLQHSVCRYIVTPFEQDQRQERPKRWYRRNSGIADAACQPNDDFLAVLRDYVFTRRVEQTVTLGQSRFFDTPRRSHKIALNEWRTGLFPGPATDRMDVFQKLPASPERAHSLDESRARLLNGSSAYGTEEELNHNTYGHH